MLEGLAWKLRLFNSQLNNIEVLGVVWHFFEQSHI